MRTVRLGVLLSLLMLTVPLSSPAHADRCEVTEPVIRTTMYVVSQVPGTEDLIIEWEEPGDEDGKPTCIVLKGFVYPLLGCDSTTLNSCTSTINICEGTAKPYLPDVVCITP
jgi:hypothetical protein